MIESIKDLKRGKDSYENLALEKTANQILHHMEDKDSEDNLESTRARVLANARAIYGPSRHLDVISFAATSSRKIGAAIVEHNPGGRSYIHCTSAKESSRLAAVEHLLVITEDLLERLISTEGITSSGWLPATQQAAHAATYGRSSVAEGSIAGSVTLPSVPGSVVGSRRGSVQPLEHYNHIVSPLSMHSASSHPPHHANAVELYQKPPLARTSSDSMHQPPQQNMLTIPRTNSDIIQQPKPVPAGRFPGGQHGGRVQWNLGSEG
ncbi:hypothetical protein BDV96DRAFT_187394 [Lophiotrema nucula]|uniref:Uncharacterized protein n=1 Tax=Lophiotrema nucula TaxID=690887 RepID=A0A6A5YYH0_9PLEO|nr:hypothetical protein BDV96DRAFT_187394 [Lophiotrema nucula]